MPTSQNIDRQLLIGSGLFGFGWGLGGMCPVSTIADAFLSLLHDVYVIEWNQIKSFYSFGTMFKFASALLQGTALYLAANGYHQVLFYWWPCNIMGAVLGEYAKVTI